MDDNENILDFHKMNFSPFTTPFPGLPANAVNQFTTAKFAQNLATANGQVVGLVSGGEGGVHYLRPLDSSGGCGGGISVGSPGSAYHNNNNSNTNNNNNEHGQLQIPNNTSTASGESQQSLDGGGGRQNPIPLEQQHQALITLPITMPGAKPGDAAQTIHIQVINPNPIQQPQQKFQMGQMQIPIQSFQPGGTTVLTVAYSPQDGKLLPNHGFPEGMSVVAALQPQDLQLLAQAQQQVQLAQQHAHLNGQGGHENAAENMKTLSNGITIKQEQPDWEDRNLNISQPDFTEYLTSSAASGFPLNLQQFIKFNPSNIKYEPQIQISTEPQSHSDETAEQMIQNTNDSITVKSEPGTIGTKPKRKRRAVKKPPKPKPPRPGQVLIATAIDGTVLFCCPECQMAYPEKENLEQHLSVHKIERRYICDICGAGLKRKEHLERHKSGHNPDRPYICSVCMKGFKRKEHLNLHFVIHSGEKNQICGECGKGFYRKDHLRKHAKSHITKRIKEEMLLRGEDVKPNLERLKLELEHKQDTQNLSLSAAIVSTSGIMMDDGGDEGGGDCGQQQQQQILQSQQQQMSNANNSDSLLMPITTTINSNGVISTTQPAISLSTVYVPTGDNTTLPVQIQIPQIVTTSFSDGTSTSTPIIPSPTSSESHQANSNAQQQQQSQQPLSGEASSTITASNLLQSSQTQHQAMMVSQ